MTVKEILDIRTWKQGVIIKNKQLVIIGIANQNGTFIYDGDNDIYDTSVYSISSDDVDLIIVVDE